MNEDGILVLATPSDWYKAVALICSIRTHNKSMPICAVGSHEVCRLLEPYCDETRVENAALRGFEHKLHLDQYSPYTNTLFLDADMLLFKDVQELFSLYRGKAYGVSGRYCRGGISCFGLLRDEIQKRLDVAEMVDTSGVGHSYFEKPHCSPVFERARYIGQNYGEFAPGIKLADEDVLSIVMTEKNIAPILSKQIVGFYLAAKNWIKPMDVCFGKCRYTDLDGDEVEPVIMHFPRDMSPVAYHLQIRNLFLHCNIKSPVGLYRRMLYDWYMGDFRNRLSKLRRLLKGRH